MYQTCVRAGDTKMTTELSLPLESLESNGCSKEGMLNLIVILQKKHHEK